MEGAIAVNWWAVIVAAAAKFIIGSIWYALPPVSGPWQRALGLTPADVKAALPRAIPIDIVANLVMAYVLARFIGHYGAAGIAEGALVGFMAWIGFVATVTIATSAYERRPFGLFAINNAYLLVTIVVMGAILGAWQAPAAAP